MRHVILHGHIFKNAGTTFDWSLSRSFGHAFLDHRDDHAMRSQGAAYLAGILSSKTELLALSSHHLPRVLPAVPDLCHHHIYLLRHPLLRVRSVYNFERVQQADTLGAKAAKRMTFKEYVLWRMELKTPATIRNFQTLYLATVRRRRQGRSCDAVDFADAMDFAQSLPALGIVEYYDESMVLLEESLRPHFPALDLAYIRQNVSLTNASDLDDNQAIADMLQELGEVAAMVIDRNSYDLALYQASLERFRTTMGSTPDFAAKLDDFRKRCAQLRGR